MSSSVSYISFFGPFVTAAFSERSYPNKKHKSFLKEIDVPLSKFISVKQVHGDSVHVVCKDMARQNAGETDVVEADALITNIPGLALGIKTADCLPVFLYDPEKNVIGLIHAGWRGLKSKIIVKTIKVMKEKYGVDPLQLKVAIGPAIRNCCYEVKREFSKKFSDKYFKERGKSLFLNLIYVAAEQLAESGVHFQNIQDLEVCTSCENERVFSYRKEKTEERILSVIQLQS